MFNLFQHDGLDNPDYAESIDDTCLLRINKKHLFECMRKTPEISFSILNAFARQMTRLGNEVLRMKSMILPQRLALFIFRLCTVETGAEIVCLPYEKTIMANQFGVTRESLSRAFQLLKGINVTTHHDHVHVHDVEVLKRYCMLQIPKLR